LLIELSAQLPVLEALFLRFSGEAAKAECPEHKAIFVKVALSAQTSFSRTVALLIALGQKTAGVGSVHLDGVSEIS